MERAYFDLSPVDRQANEIEFFLILGMLFSMILFMYILAYHQLDVTQQQLRALLSLALPRQVAERFLVDPTAYDRKARMPATIVFMDFEDFTETCERLAHAPDLLSAHMEKAMERLVVELSKQDMILDKFIGDAVMSFRGGPLVAGEPPEHAYRAVRASLDCIRELKALNDPYFSRVKIGGASAADCLIGSFGTSRRLSYTVLGDGVNLAARLEPASGQCGTQNLFCEETRRLCADRADLVWRRWGWVRVLGKAEPVEVFEVFDAATLGDSTFVATFHRALEAFERRDLRGPGRASGGPTPSARGATVPAGAMRSGSNPCSHPGSPTAGSRSSRRKNSGDPGRAGRRRDDGRSLRGPTDPAGVVMRCHLLTFDDRADERPEPVPGSRRRRNPRPGGPAYRPSRRSGRCRRPARRSARPSGHRARPRGASRAGAGIARRSVRADPWRSSATGFPAGRAGGSSPGTTRRGRATGRGRGSSDDALLVSARPWASSVPDRPVAGAYSAVRRLRSSRRWIDRGEA